MKGDKLYRQIHDLQSILKDPTTVFQTKILNNTTMVNVDRKETLLSEEVNEDCEMHINAENSDTYSFDFEGIQEKESTGSVSLSVDSLQHHFGSELILQEHLVEYNNVPLRTRNLITNRFNQRNIRYFDFSF